MTAETLLRQMSDIDPRFLEEAMPVADSRPAKRRLLPLILAAALALLLVSCGVVAAVYGGSIQSWFAHYWEAVTGQEMGESQTAVIDHLTQDIGLSQTLEGITVTLDSATVGDNCFYLLVRVTGGEFSKRLGYGFRAVEMEISPDPLADSGGMGGYGWQFHGLDGDGAALFLLDWNFSAESGFQRDTSPLDVSLKLSDFCRDVYNTEREVVAEGPWHFSFTLDRSQPLQVLELPDTRVFLEDHRERTEVSVTLTDIQLTSSGLRFCYAEGGMLAITAQIHLYLKNGARLHVGGGIGTPLEDGETMSYSFTWSVPIDVNEVAGLKIGDTYISVA